MNNEAFRSVVERLENAEAEGVVVESIIVSDADRSFRHDFGSESVLIDLRSISKVAVALTLGIAIDAGVRFRGEPLSIETKVWPFFPDYITRMDEQSAERFRSVRVHHLLSNTIGHREGFLFRKDIGSQQTDHLLSYIFDRSLEFDPGSHFSYSNVGWYLVSAMVRNELGSGLSEWVSSLLFERLGIHDFAWSMYGSYEASASGLCLSNPDLHKLGKLLLDGGSYQGRQVVPSPWIETMTRPAVMTRDEYDPTSPLRAIAYGYSMWICEDGIYYCDGSGGQYLIVVPRKHTVITVLTQQGDTKTIARCLRDIIL